jgi:hypothetical protein
MKKIVIGTLLMGASLFALAQNPADTIRQSRTVRFADSAHSLIHTELINHGHITNCTVQIYRATDMITGKTLSGLLFSDNQGHQATIDGDELPSLLAAMNHIMNKVIPAAPGANHDLYCFRSRAGFEAGCFADKNQWQLYLQLKSHDASTTTLLKKLDVEVFLEDLKDVIAVLQ